MARLEAQTALRGLLARLPDLRLAAPDRVNAAPGLLMNALEPLLVTTRQASGPAGH